jgi:c-di-GMP-related signal transduction protein
MSAPNRTMSINVDIFLARQPIFDANTHVYGYELLFRSGRDNSYDGTDDTLATSQVMNTLLSLGVETVIGHSRAFVNFSRALLIDERTSFLPPEIGVIEILESVEPDEEVLAACRRLRSVGYQIALDDVTDAPAGDRFSKFADIIKVDFRGTCEQCRGMLLERYAPRGIRMLAEKVETPAEFQQARKAGYVLFQGYFFARPVILQGKEIPGFKLNYLRILSEIHQPELEFFKLEQLIRQEVSIAYKLLKYVNSSLFMLPTKIESIRRALMVLGETEVRKWVSLVALVHLAADKPPALISNALIRASFCESIAQLAGMGGRNAEFFLMGLFSLLDAIMDRPLEEVLKEIYLAPDIRGALFGAAGHGKATDIHELMRCYERADWERVQALADRLPVERAGVTEAYLAALRWCEQVFSTMAVQDHSVKSTN